MILIRTIAAVLMVCCLLLARRCLGRGEPADLVAVGACAAAGTILGAIACVGP